jgi:pyridoxine 4-dehydrogenase
VDTSLQNESVTAGASGRLRLPGGLEFNRLGFGAMRITGDGVWGPPRDRSEAIRVLRRAVELGVQLIDTADSYGPAVSEELIAEALHPYPAGLVIATKGGLTRPGPNDWRRNAQPDHLRSACEGSLKRLRVDCIDLYQLHMPDPAVPYEESVGVLAELQKAGKIRHIGVSNVTVDELRRAQALVQVVSVQNRYNFNDRLSDDVLNVCTQEGLGFLPWGPLTAGRFRITPGPLKRIALQTGATVKQVLIAWLLARSPVMAPIPGTSSVEHLEENIGAAALRLRKEDLRELD